MFKAFPILMALFASSALAAAPDSIIQVNPAAQSTKASAPATPKYDPNDYTARGFRLGVFHFRQDYRETVRNTSKTETIESSNGLSLGYGRIPVGGVGIILEAALIQMQDPELIESMQMTRVEGDLAFGINQNFYLKTGINSAQFSTGPSTSATSDVGFQFGGGYQITKAFGVELAYVQSSQKATAKTENPDERLRVEYKVQYQQSGPQLGLIGTF